MTKRGIARIVLGTLAAVTLFGFYWTFFGVHEIRMPQADLQQKIDAKLPHTTKNGITVSAARLDLADNKVGINVHASMTNSAGPVALLKGEYKVDGGTRGDLRYDSARGSFYFHPDKVDINRVQLNGKTVFDKQVASKVGSVVGKWTGANVNGLGQKLQDGMQSAAESVLDHTPVYTLPDTMKGWVARSSLTKVEVRDGAVIAHISLWQLTYSALGYALGFLLTVILLALLLLCPVWLESPR